MRIVTGTLAALVAATTISLPLAQPATAAGESITVENGLYSDSCSDVDYVYTLDTVHSDYYKDASVTITVTDRFGSDVASAYDDGGYAGYDTLTVCADRAGTFNVETEVFGCTYDYDDCRTVSGPSTTFKLAKPRTRTALSASPVDTHHNQVVTFKVLRREEYARGSYRPDSGYVTLQLQSHGKWVPVRASRTFAYRGHASLKYRVPGTLLKIRAASIQPGFETSYSRPVTLR